MEMVSCPYCGGHIPQRALSCRHCKRLFVQLDVSETDSPIKTIKVVSFPKNKVAPEKTAADSSDGNSTSDSTKISPLLLEPLKAHELALFIDKQPIPLIVAVSPLAILGRHAENTLHQPHIDLVPFGAFEKGVSRFHACLRYERTQFEIEDLGSSNGTWLNERRLLTSQPTPIQVGDIIRLGELKLEVMFIDTPADDSSVSNTDGDAEV